MYFHYIFEENPNNFPFFLTHYVIWLCLFLPTYLLLCSHWTYCAQLTVSDFTTACGAKLFPPYDPCMCPYPWQHVQLSLFPWMISSRAQVWSVPPLERTSLSPALFFSHCNVFFSFRKLSTVWILFSFVNYLYCCVFSGMLQEPLGRRLRMFHSEPYSAHCWLAISQWGFLEWIYKRYLQNCLYTLNSWICKISVYFHPHIT